MNIYEYLHLVKMYRENIVFRENNNGLISLNERAKLDQEIREQERKIDIYGFKFRDISCNDCSKYKSCFKSANPSFNCFDYEPTSRS